MKRIWSAAASLCVFSLYSCASIREPATPTIQAAETQAVAPSSTAAGEPTLTRTPRRTSTSTDMPEAPEVLTATPMATRLAGDEAIILAEIDDGAEDLVWSPDGRILYLATKQGLIAYDVSDGGEIYYAGRGIRIRAIAISPDGQTLAVGIAGDGTVRLIDALTGDLVATMEGHTDWLEDVAFQPDGNYLASSADDGRVLLWDAHTGEFIREIFSDSGWATGLAFSPDGQRLAIGNQGGFQIVIVDTQSWEQVSMLDEDEADDIAFAPNGRFLASASGGWHLVTIWDTSTGEDLFRLEGHPSWVWAVAFSPNGERVASGGIGEVILLWNARTGELDQELYTGVDFIQSLAFSPDGNTLASVGANGTVLLWPTR